MLFCDIIYFVKYTVLSVWTDCEFCAEVFSLQDFVFQLPACTSSVSDTKRIIIRKILKPIMV